MLPGFSAPRSAPEWQEWCEHIGPKLAADSFYTDPRIAALQLKCCGCHGHPTQWDMRHSYCGRSKGGGAQKRVTTNTVV